MPTRGCFFAFATVALWITTETALAVPESAWVFDSAAHQYFTRQGGINQVHEYDPPPTVGVEALSPGFRVFGAGVGGGVFQLTGATYVPPSNSLVPRNRLVLTGSATIDMSLWDPATDRLDSRFKFDWEISGGQIDFGLDVQFIVRDLSGSILEQPYRGTGFGPALTPGSHHIDHTVTNQIGGNIGTGVSIDWIASIGYRWTNYSSTDTLAIRMPHGFGGIQVPGPGAAAVPALGVIAVRRRRANRSKA